MKNSLGSFTILAKRWVWLVVLGIIIFSGATFAISKMIRPVYQASAILIVNLGTSTSAFDNLNASVAVIPTYVQLLVTPPVLQPVVAHHKGLTLQQLKEMVTLKPQLNTHLIELDVESSNPGLAMELANEISHSFAQFSSTQLTGTVRIVPAQEPTNPIRPRLLQDTAIGALVGLGLALALIVIFEWIDDRLASPQEVRELLSTEILTLIPQLSRKERTKKAKEIPALVEAYRTLSARLHLAEERRPFKLVMVTSALSHEGKSTVAVHLATALAAAGKRVLLVDINLRRPVLDQHFQLDGHQGLASALLEMGAQTEVKLAGQATDIPGLHVLRAGVLPSNSIDLLQSAFVNHLFECFKKAPFDYVILDTPPLLPVADAQLLASHTEGVVMVVDASKTPRKTLLEAKRLLETDTRILGVVINKSPWPGYGSIGQFLKDIQRPKGTLMTPPNISLPDSLVEPMDGSKGLDITLTLPSPPKTEGEKS